MKITHFKDKAYNRLHELLTEEDDFEDVDDRTLSQTISDIINEAFNAIGTPRKIEKQKKKEDENIRMIDGKPVVEVYNQDFDPNIDYGFNLVFEKTDDPASDMQFTDEDLPSKIIKVDFQNGRKL